MYQALVVASDGDWRTDFEREYAKALRSVRSFKTRYGADFTIEEARTSWV